MNTERNSLNRDALSVLSVAGAPVLMAGIKLDTPNVFVNHGIVTKYKVVY